jgi:hypothetical protein
MALAGRGVDGMAARLIGGIAPFIGDGSSIVAGAQSPNFFAHLIA